MILRCLSLKRSKFSLDFVCLFRLVDLQYMGDGLVVLDHGDGGDTAGLLVAFHDAFAFSHHLHLGMGGVLPDSFPTALTISFVIDILLFLIVLFNHW